MPFTYEEVRESVRISISATVDRFVIDLEEAIDQMVIAGMTPQAVADVLQNDLDTGGRIFGSFKNGTASSIRNGVENVSNAASNAVFESQGLDHRLWKTAGVNVCPDCESRAGLTGTMEYFETIGVPKSGFSVCRANCQCQLVPVHYDREENIIIKEKKN